MKIETIAEYCENEFHRSECSKTLLVFLPSVNGRGVYPYYPRHSWASILVKWFNILYISDPYQPLPQYKESGGSWFISPDGEMTLPVLAKKIENFADAIDANNIVFYGSSMGGYAAIVLGSMVKGGKVVAECPQLYLEKHPGSRFVCETLLDQKNLH